MSEPFLPTGAPRRASFFSKIRNVKGNSDWRGVLFSEM
jgi:hypothetical protein